MPSPSADNRRILIVEDDLTSASALRAILARRGFEVFTAVTIREGLSQLRAARPQWIILDLMLPDGEGEEILRHVRGAGLAMRVAVTTGASDPDRIDRVKSLAPELLLHKPIDLGALLRFLEPQA